MANYNEFGYATPLPRGPGRRVPVTLGHRQAQPYYGNYSAEYEEDHYYHEYPGEYPEDPEPYYPPPPRAYHIPPSRAYHVPPPPPPQHDYYYGPAPHSQGYYAPPPPPPRPYDYYAPQTSNQSYYDPRYSDSRRAPPAPSYQGASNPVPNARIELTVAGYPEDLLDEDDQKDREARLLYLSRYRRDLMAVEGTKLPLKYPLGRNHRIFINEDPKLARDLANLEEEFKDNLSQTRRESREIPDTPLTLPTPDFPQLRQVSQPAPTQQASRNPVVEQNKNHLVYNPATNSKDYVLLTVPPLLCRGPVIGLLPFERYQPEFGWDITDTRWTKKWDYGRLRDGSRNNGHLSSSHFGVEIWYDPGFCWYHHWTLHNCPYLRSGNCRWNHERPSTEWCKAMIQTSRCNPEIINWIIQCCKKSEPNPKPRIKYYTMPVVDENGNEVNQPIPEDIRPNPRLKKPNPPTCNPRTSDTLPSQDYMYEIEDSLRALI